MVAAWSMCWERGLVRSEARESRAARMTESGVVLMMAPCRVMVRLMRFGVLVCSTSNLERWRVRMGV
jgi:hypothetical protein